MADKRNRMDGIHSFISMRICFNFKSEFSKNRPFSISRDKTIIKTSIERIPCQSRYVGDFTRMIPTVYIYIAHIYMYNTHFHAEFNRNIFKAIEPIISCACKTLKSHITNSLLFHFRIHVHRIALRIVFAKDVYKQQQKQHQQHQWQWQQQQQNLRSVILYIFTLTQICLL